MKEEDKKKKSYTKHVIISAVAIMGSFFIASYIIGGDPCFERAEGLQQLAIELQGNFDNEFISEYEMFLADCGHMIDMEEQKRSNPELHKRIEIKN